MVREIIFQRIIGQVHQRRTLASIVPAGPSAFSASCDLAQRIRYSTAAISPSRRLRHWTSPEQLLVATSLRVGKEVGKRAAAKFLLRASLDRLEARSNARLCRKGGKQGLREAWMVWIAGRQGLLAPSRTAAARARIVGGSFGSRSAKRSFFRSAILNPHPGSEPRANAVGHLSCCSLGEGQAQDRSPAPRRTAATGGRAGQHLRLARTCRCRQRRVRARVGGARLITLQLMKRLNRGASGGRFHK